MKRKRLIGKWLNYLIYVSIMLILVIVIQVTYQRLRNPNEPIYVFGYTPYFVVSESMEPTFYKGDLLISRKSNDIEIGDIVVFKMREDIISHRVVDKKMVDGEINFITRGDNNTFEDRAIKESNILSEVKMIIPKVGNIIETFQSNYVLMVLCIMFPTFLLFTWSLIDFKKAMRQ